MFHTPAHAAHATVDDAAYVPVPHAVHVVAPLLTSPLPPPTGVIQLPAHAAVIELTAHAAHATVGDAA